MSKFNKTFFSNEPLQTTNQLFQAYSSQTHRGCFACRSCGCPEKAQNNWYWGLLKWGSLNHLWLVAIRRNQAKTIRKSLDQLRSSPGCSRGFEIFRDPPANILPWLRSCSTWRGLVNPESRWDLAGRLRAEVVFLGAQMPGKTNWLDGKVVN